MASKLTNRVVGALALLAVAVIVLPELLTGKPDAVVDPGDEIPLAPDMAVVGEPELARGDAELTSAEQALPAETERMDVDTLLATPLQEGVSGQAIDGTASQQPMDAAEAVTEAKPGVTTDAVAEPKPLPGQTSAAYSIQLGVFSNAANVAQLVAKLRAVGFKVYTVPAKPVDGKPTRVLVGPNTQRSALEPYLPRLKELTNLDGRIVTYDPLAP